jgi:Flp pilus assembly protein TadD
VTLLSFWPVLAAGFLGYDDPAYVTANPMVRGGVTAGSLGWALTTFHATNWHPLTWLAHLAVVEAGGLAPRAHHLANLALHLANVVLLRWVLLRATGSAGLALGVALLFAVHPLHVESVAWVAELKDLLATLLTLLALTAYLRYSRRPSVGRFLPVAALLLLALMAKPMPVTFPFVLLLLDWWPLGRWRRAGGVLPAVAEKLPLLALAAGSAALTVAAQGAGAVTSFGVLPPTLRLGNAILSYAVYLGRMCWPFSLSVFYPHPLAGLPWTGAAAAGLLLAVVTAAAVVLRRNHPWLPVGWFFFLGTLVPVIGLVQAGLQGMADRYTYLPLTGIFLAVLREAGRVAGHPRLRHPALAALLLTSAALAGATRLQAGYWRDDRTLFGHALAVNPANWLAHNNLGMLLAAENRREEALGHFRASVALRPSVAKSHLLLGSALLGAGRAGEAVASLRRAVGLDPALREAGLLLAVALADLGDHAGAGQEFRRTILLDPAHAGARREYARFLADRGRLEESAGEYGEAIRLQPDAAPGHAGLGAVLARLGRTGEAAAAYSRALRIDPGQPEVLNNLGVLLLAEGRRAEAAAQFRRVLGLSPGHAAARLNLDLALRGSAAAGGAP